MTDPLYLLQTIKPVAIDHKVYQTIVEKIAISKPIVPLQWLHTAAAILICFISIEGYLLASESSQGTNDFSELITQTDNTLYYE